MTLMLTCLKISDQHDYALAVYQICLTRYELPSGTFTFYYMELALEAKLQRKVNQLKEILTKSKGQIQYDWKAVQYIQSRYNRLPIIFRISVVFLNCIDI